MTADGIRRVSFYQECDHWYLLYSVHGLNSKSIGAAQIELDGYIFKEGVELDRQENGGGSRRRNEYDQNMGFRMAFSKN